MEKEEDHESRLIDRDGPKYKLQKRMSTSKIVKEFGNIALPIIVAAFVGILII